MHAHISRHSVSSKNNGENIKLESAFVYFSDEKQDRIWHIFEQTTIKRVGKTGFYLIQSTRRDATNKYVLYILCDFTKKQCFIDRCQDFCKDFIIIYILEILLHSIRFFLFHSLFGTTINRFHLHSSTQSNDSFNNVIDRKRYGPSHLDHLLLRDSYLSSYPFLCA